MDVARALSVLGQRVGAVRQREARVIAKSWHARLAFWLSAVLLLAAFALALWSTGAAGALADLDWR